MEQHKVKKGKMFLPVIGAYLKEQRERRGIKQETVTNELGISRSNVTKYEKGTVDIPASRIAELCQLYECRMAECGKRVDDEMGFADMAKQASGSDFVCQQYMAFVSDTPMIPADEEVLAEKEFSELIRVVTAFLGWGLQEINVSDVRCEQLKKNFTFFMVEFIKLNEPDVKRRERLVMYCNEMLKEYIRGD